MPRNTTSKAATSASVSGAAATSAILTVVLTAAGFGGGVLVGQTLGAKKHYDRGYATAWEEAKKKVDASSFATPVVLSNTLTGTVTTVGAASFEMDTPSLVRNPLDTQTPTKRTVLVSESTSIIVTIDRPRAEFDKEMEAFRAAMEEYQETIADANANEPVPTSPTPPMPFTEKKGTLADVKTGMIAMVTAASDISYAETITATEVRVSAASTIPLPPPAGDTSSAPRPGSALPPPDPTTVPQPTP